MTIYDRIREIGRRFDPEVLTQTRALLEPLWSDAGQKVEVETAAYGDDERQVSDIYWSEGDSKPVLVFIPGGGFVAGTRTAYKAFGEYFARQGFVVVIADYRLAPKAVWPAGSQDVSSVIEWAGANAQRYGGCANNLFVLGHSAGGMHVAGAVFDPRFKPKNDDNLRGVILASGLYSVGQDEKRPNVIAYFGEDTSTYADRSPLSYVGNSNKNVLLMLAEHDPLPFVSSTFELAKELAMTNDRTPKFYMADKHNHISSVLAVGTDHDGIVEQVLAFVAENKSAAS